jgi:formyl-CoA transferase
MVGAQFSPRWTRRTTPNPIINHYVTRDGKRFITCCIDAKKDWLNLCRALEHMELVDDPRFSTGELRRANGPELVAIIDKKIATRDMDEWVRIFRKYDVIWGPVPGTQDVARDQQMEANGVFTEIAPGLRTVYSPINVDGVPKVKPKMAPELGEHTIEILRDLGYTGESIADLIHRGAAMASNPGTPDGPSRHSHP